VKKVLCAKFGWSEYYRGGPVDGNFGWIKKGASSENGGFFLTRNEHNSGYKKDSAWRLAMMTRALSDEPVVQIFDAKKLRKAFDLTPYVYLGRPVVEPEAT
jgi:hypothetical protein